MILNLYLTSERSQSKNVLKSDFVVAVLKLNYYNINSSEEGFWQ